ncbi:MAG: 50S ribosomal protein L25/general stress protein Ctc [Mycobacteriales bacterium]
MADEIRIASHARTEFGKGAARRIRRDHNVPAVLYGHGIDPIHLTLPGHQMMLALKNSNALLTIDMDGGSNQLALAKAVQRDPIKGVLEHIDLIAVRRGEKVTIEVPVTLDGEAAPDTLVNHELTAISVEAEATHIPASFSVSIAGLTVGDTITAADVPLPAGVTLTTEADYTVVSILAVPTAEQVEAELAEAEAEVGIEHEEPEAASEQADGDDEAAAGGSGEQSGDSAADRVGDRAGDRAGE